MLNLQWWNGFADILLPDLTKYRFLGVMTIGQLIVICTIAIGAYVAIFFIERITIKKDGAKEKRRLNDNNADNHTYPNSIALWGLGWSFSWSLLSVAISILACHFSASLICSYCGLKIGNAIFYVMDSVIGTYVASLLNICVVFDDDGITVRYNLWILSFRVRRVVCLIHWNRVQVGFYTEYIRGIIPINTFILKLPMRDIVIRCERHQREKRRECLAFVVKKLPAYSFTTNARSRLKEMGLWPNGVEVSSIVAKAQSKDELKSLRKLEETEEIMGMR
jgi:hypothetical protein